jgi:hypothetical protein
MFQRLSSSFSAGAIAFSGLASGLAFSIAAPAQANPSFSPQPYPSDLWVNTSPVSPTANDDFNNPSWANAESNSGPAIDFKLNRKQRDAVSGLSDFAFEQFDTILDSGVFDNGFDPKKLNNRFNRRQAAERAATVQNLLTSFFQLDDQQKGSLRDALQKARDQVKRDLDR